MKKILSICVFTLAFIAITIGSGFAGNGKGPGDGSGPLIDECPNAFDIIGVVLYNQQGGLVVETDAGVEYTVWGLGPNSYWDDIAKPIGGDDVTITIVNCGDEEPRYVAITIILEDQTTIELRDPTTCSPLWR